MAQHLHLNTFTFEGKLETITDDIKVIFSQYGVANASFLLTEAKKVRKYYEKSNTASAMYRELWDSVTRETVEHVREIYSEDIHMLGYSDHF